MLFVREPIVPRRIVQKLLADLQARRTAPLERAIDVRQMLASRVPTSAVGERLWATFARCAARGQIRHAQNAT